MGSAKGNPPRPRKRVDAEMTTLKRARDGSAFTRCEACNKDVAVALIDMHSCTLDSQIKMNLEAQVVEKASEVKKPAERKRAAPSSDRKEKKAKKGKKTKDPNGPKRPPTAFFLFMDDFRKSYKESNPDSKGAPAVAKEGGAKWKSMTDEEKKPYMDAAAQLKADYEKANEKPIDDNEEEKDESGKEEEEEKGESGKEEE